MPHRSPPAPESAPAPLPDALLGELIRAGPLLLCLDYDGTIAEIVSRPALARPLEGVVPALRSLAQHRGRIAVAIVSGRPIAELRRMTGLDREVMFAGVHGLEIAGRDGETRVLEDTARCAPELGRVREWLKKNVPPDAGFEVEDKRLSVALHYRNAKGGAAALCARFEELVRHDAPHLRAAHNKMVIEALPAAASKGHALRALIELAGSALMPVYFGDDRTDEDVFAELAERGIAVMVGAARPSLARWRVDAPADVARILAGLAASLAPASSSGSA